MGKWKYLRKACPRVTLSTNITIRTALRLNLGLCGEKPVPNHLSYSMANTDVSTVQSYTDVSTVQSSALTL